MPRRADRATGRRYDPRPRDLHVRGQRRLRRRPRRRRCKLDLVLKWQPTNAKDNSQSGYTETPSSTASSWTAPACGASTRAAISALQHYTQFQVYDYDGDGKAEVAMKTADGTRDGTGAVIGNSLADHRNSSGCVLAGPEY
ncbi:hypothetical protein ACIQ6Y_32120 [Streptomyces sp. NPDC096205]|uniref:rhamnogalacturonan lyase family protein n=1 Tax=Streptomyces sp. NPDC096205 TaxID=3366081 RepID=UPI0037FCDE30